MTVEEMVAQLDATSRAYTSLLKAAVRLQLQIHAHERSIKRWYAIEEETLVALFSTGVTPHLHEALGVIRKPKRYYERTIRRLAEELPVYPWVEKIRGFGALGFGLIIGQTGDLSGYANPAKVWKRMGLAVGTDGNAQRRVAGSGGIAQGFSPTRRALMHVVGDALLKQNKGSGGGEGEYRTLYRERKALEALKVPDAEPIVAHRRALRYMEKRLLRNLWRAWQSSCPMSPTQGLPATPLEVCDAEPR